MIINKANIKTLMNITSTTYDTKIDALYPILLDKICSYCKRDFIQKNYSSYLFENVSLVITQTTITTTTTLPLQPGDFIRLYETQYNDGMYQIKTYTNGVITIETAKVMRAETINGVIGLVEFPCEFIELISEHFTNTIIGNSNVSSEKIDDVQINYFQNSSASTFIQTNANILNNYRLLFKQTYTELFGGDC